MTWKLWHSVATFSVGFAIVVGCGSNEDDTTNPYQPCGNGGNASVTSSTQDAVTTVGQQSTAVGPGPSTSVSQSSAVASSVASSAASGGGNTCSPATCNGANCCCTFNGTTLCIGSAMCAMGGGKCM